jgi:hypothetical protein
MTKYTRVQRKTEERRWNVHPIWRGIGCAMILIIIVMAYALAKELIDYNEKSHQFDLPDFLYNKVFISYTKYIPALKEDDVVNKFLANFKVGTLIFMLIFMFIGFGAFSFAYSALYRVSGPSRYSPLDSPPVGKPRKRR